MASMDKLSKEKRSWNMSRIRSKNTKPELFIRYALWHKGLRYRKNPKEVFGKPDIYIPKYKVAVFVHGCFWHRHSGCKYAYTPKSRIDFWQKKFQANIDRDHLVKNTLISQNIRVIVVWECTTKKNKEITEQIYKEIIDGKKEYIEY